MAKKKTRKAARKAAKTSSAKKAKKAAAKKTAKKTLKKGATKSVKRTVKKPSKKAPAPRLKKTAPAKPRMPRRTPQAAPPPAPPAPAPAALAPPAVVLNEGQRAPDFNLADDQGGMHTLSGYRGRTVVLYFYPKDDTPGCTTEACGFRDTLGQFSDRGAVVLGVSPDDVSSHQKFIAKYGLTFPLLADEDHSVAERYGVWVEKSMYGKTYWGIARTTFVIAPDGTIRKIFRGVRPKGHEAEVLAALG